MSTGTLHAREKFRMNKLAITVVSVGLLVAGYYIGQSRVPAPTVINVGSAPKAVFSTTADGVSSVAPGRAC